MNQRICAYISLDAVYENLHSMKANLAEGVMMCCVIKADGYGHGAYPIARTIQEEDYIWGFAVACVSEAVELRDAGITKPILILGTIFPDEYETVVRAQIRTAVYTESMARGLSEAAGRLGHTAHIHLKVDTGMGRIGMIPDEESVALCKEMAKLPNLHMEGLFTHFARADEVSLAPAQLQLDRFVSFSARLREEGLLIPIVHCSNSAGIMQFPQANLDMVRAGISLYGLFPSTDVKDDPVHLSPVMSLKSHIAYIKTVQPGQAISYGGTFVAEQAMQVATIPVGYADGYPRSLSNKGFVLIRGQKAPILGRVCMDQFMVDVSAIPGVSLYDEVTLLGQDGDEQITAEFLGDLSGRFNYELVCDINKRVPRVYILQGKAIELQTGKRHISQE